ncbi:hypothetical protein MRB53_000510 [Persea americana]|uniref:Uncharacterized protein n=1 Tax=Persea americana TaxID=3435 RepID=A0ACC2MP18_PERAE|nr:hypothetical protein MRB53_000510 [Persea americana]
MASSSYLLCFIILLLHMNLQAVECPSLGNETDRVALLAIKNRITLDPLGALSSRNDSLHFCMWPGVTFSHRRQRAVTLDIASLDLEGSMSPIITVARDFQFYNFYRVAQSHSTLRMQIGKI